MAQFLRGRSAAAAGEAALLVAAPWRRTASASYHNTIQAVPRETAGPRAAARERRHGRVPAVLLTLAGAAPGEGVAHRKLLTADRKQIAEVLKQSPYFLSTPVLPLKVRRDETTGNILNLVMVQADEGMMLKVNLPVEFKGEGACPGLKKGGFLQKIRTSLLYLCPAEHIPPKIEVDLSNLDVGDRVLMHDIPVHPSLKLLSKNEIMPICKILASKPVE
jgi:large subunit ribosomal protein L25